MLVFFLYFLSSALSISIITYLENSNPHKSLAWILIVLLLPIIGFLLYLLTGHHFAKRNKYHYYAKRFQGIEQTSNYQNEVLEDNELRGKEKLLKLLNKTAKAPLTSKNSSQVFFNGEETFLDIIKALKQAKRHIHLEFYIYRDDQIGNKIKDVLLAKAREGVEIRFIYDGLGSRKLSQKFIAELNNADIQTACFEPFSFPWLNNKINYRNHRKIIVVDGQLGYLGGMNVGDEYLNRNPKFPFWRDCQLKIEGEAVNYLQQIFLLDWGYLTNQNLNGEKYYPDKTNTPERELIQIVGDGPNSKDKPIMQMFLAMIGTAEKSIYLTTPYFIPNPGIYLALENAALSGLDVRILIPGKSDKPLVLAASMAYLGKLLASGAKIYQYQKGFVHSKTLVIDGFVSSIGTANMDMRSFDLNFEINAFLYNSKLAEQMVDNFFRDLKDSKEIDYDTYQMRSFTTKISESTGQIFAPLL